MAPKLHVVLKASYVDLPKFTPERNTHTIINILSYFCSHTTNAALRSNNLLLYIPNCPRPSSHLLYFQALYINFGLYLQECWQSTVLVHLDSQFPVLTAVIITDVISSEHSLCFMSLFTLQMLQWFSFSLTYWQNDCLIVWQNK